MGFAEPRFVVLYFFTPLIITMFVTYFIGIIFLPSLLHHVPENSCLTRVVHESQESEEYSTEPQVSEKITNGKDGDVELVENELVGNF